MNSNQSYKISGAGYVDGGRYGESLSSQNYHDHSSSLIDEERGYRLGVEDERRKHQMRIWNIVTRLKARGYPIRHIAEDIGISVDEIAVM